MEAGGTGQRFPCPDCGRTFARARAVAGHREAVHAGSRPFACTYPGCDLRFSRIYELRRHVAGVHEKKDADGPFRCDCGAGFARADGLARHRKKCEGEETEEHVCGACGKNFSRRDALKRHCRKSGHPIPALEGEVGGNAAAAGGLDDEPAYWAAHDQPGLPWTPVTPELALPDSPGIDLLARAAAASPPVPSASQPRIELHDLHFLYPEFPPDLLPPFPVVASLLAFHQRFDGVIHAMLHYPTLLRDVRTGRASIGVLASAMMGAVRLLGDDFPESRGWTRRRLSGDAMRSGLLNFVEEWIVGELTEVRASPQKQSLERLKHLGVALCFARAAALGMNRVDLHNRYHSDVVSIFPLLRFGEIAADTAPRPNDAAAWIRCEERSRLCAHILFSDAVIAESIDLPTTIVPPRPLIRDPSTDLFVERWANLLVPCSDAVFDAVEPEGELNAASLAPHPQFTIGQYVSLADVLQSPAEKDHFLRHAVGELLERGVTAGFLLFAGFNARLLVIKRMCTEMGYPLHEPTNPQCAAARLLVASAMEDMLGSLDPAVAEADENGDGRAILRMAEAVQGHHRAPYFIQLLVFMHSALLLVNTPYDVVDSWKIEERGRPAESILQAYPEHPAFLTAETHALHVSRLAKDLLGSDGAPDVRSLPPVWAQIIVRASWMHVVAVRRLHRVVSSAPNGAADPGAAAAAEAAAGLLEEIRTASSSLNNVGKTWGHMALTLAAFSQVLAMDAEEIGGEGHGVWARLSREDLLLLKGFMAS